MNAPWNAPSNAPRNLSACKSLFDIGGIGAFDLYLYLNLEKKKKREEGYRGEINTQVYPQNECPNAPLAFSDYAITIFAGHSECPRMHPGDRGMPHTEILSMETPWAA